MQEVEDVEVSEVEETQKEKEDREFLLPPGCDSGGKLAILWLALVTEKDMSSKYGGVTFWQ